jgi:tetratricopeptide (TPR) repeat protein
MDLNTAKMPLVDRVKKSHRKEFTIAGVAIVVVVALVYGGSYLYWRLVPSATTSVNQAQTLDNDGHYGQAISLLQGAYNRAIFKSDKIKILVWLGASESDAGNYHAAFSYYEALNTMQPNNEDNLFGLAQAATQIGDTSVELSADEQMLPLLESARPKAPTTDADVAALKQQIQELKQ